MKKSSDAAKVCLVFPNFLSRNFLLNDVQIHPPLSLGYLAATLRNAGHDVLVIDAAAKRASVKTLLGEITSYAPDVIGITTNIALSPVTISTAKAMKERDPSTPVVMGGPWASVKYRVLLERGLADYVVIGEGERTMCELVQALHEGREPRDVHGIALRDDVQGVVTTPAREPILDLDDIPFPAWDLFPPARKYNFVHRRSPFYPVMTSRGCPFDCIHCTKIVQGYAYRKRSVKNVIDEIRYLTERFGAKEILIVDDCFNLDVPRAEAIFDEILKEGFDLTINFSNGIRADRFPRRLASKFKAAGVYTISFGIESGNQEIVKKIGKQLDLGEVERSVQLAMEKGMLTKGFFILGHPFDTYTTMMETPAFARKLNLDLPHFFKSVPFPGTKMHDMIREHGHMRQVDGGKRSEYYKAYTVKTANFDIWNLHAEDIERAFVNSYRLFYLRPLKLLQIITKLKSFSELAWLFVSFLKIIIRYVFYK